MKEKYSIVEEQPKVSEILDNNLRQGQKQVIKQGRPTIKKVYYEEINGLKVTKGEEIIEMGEDRVIRVGMRSATTNGDRSDM